MGEHLDEAISLAEKASELRPSDAFFFATLPELYEKNGDRPKAIEAAKRAVELRPYHELFQERLKTLQE